MRATKAQSRALVTGEYPPLNLDRVTSFELLALLKLQPILELLCIPSTRSTPDDSSRSSARKVTKRSSTVCDLHPCEFIPAWTAIS